MRSPVSRPAPSLVALSTAAVLALAGCAGGEDSKSSRTPSPSSSSTSPTPSSTVQVPSDAKLTEQGSKLSFGDAATVIFEPARGRGTTLKLTVTKVRQGSLADFRGFILDDAYKKKASYYYADVKVKNLGEGNVGGVPVPLWGVNDANTLLPAVNFTTRFKKCASEPLPKKFAPGKSLSTCLVYLAPDRGKLESVSYRPSQEYNPITWTGSIEKPAPTKKSPKKSKKKTGARR